MAKLPDLSVHFHSPEEFEAYLTKLGIDVEEENRLDLLVRRPW